ncbi:MAG TPA: hypothetical protein VNF68_00305 [Candidatus Baltobacteraceae bacterium]|nr:hypothetical protein [Candidatus Baltobacteraceae bacterium]
MAWPAWILAICAATSLVCCAIATVIAGLAIVRVSKHVQATTHAFAEVADVSRTEANLARITAVIDAVDPLAARARAAVGSIRASLDAMRLPEAMLALRAARAAVRLLVSGR